MAKALKHVCHLIYLNSVIKFTMLQLRRFSVFHIILPKKTFKYFHYILCPTYNWI